MEVVSESSAAEAVLEWLRAELGSVRFRRDLDAAIAAMGCDETIITAAQLGNESDDAVRWRILRSYRTWLDRDLENYSWVLVELNREEVSSLSYLDYSYWNELSEGTRRVERAATNIARGRTVFDVPNDSFFAVADIVEAGVSLPPIIVVADQNDGAAEILEGHARATGYSLARQAAQPLRAIWGIEKDRLLPRRTSAGDGSRGAGGGAAQIDPGSVVEGGVGGTAPGGGTVRGSGGTSRPGGGSTASGVVLS